METRQSNAQLRSLRLQVLLFLALWLFYGCLINSLNLNAFGLQQAVVDAYVSRHHLYLDGATDPRFQVEPAGDAFLFNGHIYPAKQPGGFIMGALIYFPVHALGLNYSNHYLLSAALVTFFTASLIAALSAVFVFKTARLFVNGASLFWPLGAALAYATATTLFAYSGIPWHDTIATGYLAMAFYFVVRLRLSVPPRHERLLTAAAGACLGLTITSSMLPLLMAAVLVGYFVSLRRWRLVIPFVAGLALGLAPLLIYNTVCFGNPVLVPNLAGNYSDTFWRPSFANLIEKTKFYARMITLYVPMFWLGLAGLTLYGSVLRREQVALSVMVIMLFAYLLNIEANGTCQYGPRYLLPAMPFAALGLLGFKSIRTGITRRIFIAVLILVITISVCINFVGAMHGAMLCYFPHFAVMRYLSEMANGQMGSFPLAKWLIIPLAISAGLLAITLRSIWKNQQLDTARIGIG